MPRLSFTALANPRRGNAWLVACVLLGLGTIVIELINPNLLRHPLTARVSAYRLPYGDSFYRQAMPDSRVYAAQVVRIIDGDTFVARLRASPDTWPSVWSGPNLETHVRLRRIDAAELHARCGKELRLALAARSALQRLLADGSITLSQVGRDKYPERVDANVATRGTADVSAAMLSGGFARAYDGGRRGTWCR
jgi:endonuclease YncB( thermonuclease family)